MMGLENVGQRRQYRGDHQDYSYRHILKNQAEKDWDYAEWIDDDETYGTINIRRFEEPESDKDNI